MLFKKLLNFVWKRGLFLNMCVSSATTLVVESTLAFVPMQSCWKVCIWTEAAGWNVARCVDPLTNASESAKFLRKVSFEPEYQQLEAAWSWWNLWQAMIVSTRIFEFIYIYIWICHLLQNFDSIYKEVHRIQRGQNSECFFLNGRRARFWPPVESRRS